MILSQNEKFILRTWEVWDEESLAYYANNKNISINMTDSFPYPYTLENAKRWISHCQEKEKEPEDFAIVIDGKTVGGCWLKHREGNNRICKEIGYRLGEAYRGQGIVPQAVRVLIDYIFTTYAEIQRIEAKVFDWNKNSPKVLQKLWFTHEWTLRNNIIKDWKKVGELIYSLLREERSAMK